MSCFNSLCSISLFSHMVTLRCAIFLLMNWREVLQRHLYMSLSLEPSIIQSSYHPIHVDRPSLSAFECLYCTAMCIYLWNERGREGDFFS